MIDPGLDGVKVTEVASLSAILDGGTPVGPYSSARPGMLLRVVPGVGRFLALEGRRLEYWREPGALPGTVEAMLQGGVFGALIHQRGELPLHATTLVHPGRDLAVAVAGDSGAGKSTTAFALIRRGWVLLSDDLSRITLEDGKPTARPGRSHLRLLADACAHFGLDTGALTPVPHWPGKYQVELPRWDRPLRLAAMVVLRRSDGQFGLDRCTGAAAAAALAEQTYRAHYVAALGQTRRHFELIAGASAEVKVLRSRGRAGVEEVAAAIEAATAIGATLQP